MDQLKEAGILASAPAGIALTTPKNIQLSSGHTFTATAGENVDMSIFKRFTVAAGEAISLFAQKLGIKIFAARGRLTYKRKRMKYVFNLTKICKSIALTVKLY